MRRFFVEEIREEEGCCLITHGEALHITKVLRMEKGDRLILMDSKGNHFESEIEFASRREVRVRLIRQMSEAPLSSVKINICQAILKSKAMDYMIEKTSELGVSKVMPFFSERTVINLDSKRTVNKERHWREIAKSASKQSGRFTPAIISQPVDFEDILTMNNEEMSLRTVLWEQEESRDLKEILRTYSFRNCFTGIIGPEGGFTQNEIDALKNKGFVTISLGSRILRAETAAIALVTLVQYEWGDLGVA